MAMPPTYKPSPLSFGSPRTSPFRRPESPVPSLTTSRPTTPSPSPTKIQAGLLTPSKLTNATSPTSNDGSWTPRALTPSMTVQDRPVSPTRASTFSVQDATRMTRAPPTSDALSKLPASQVREMREAFQVLDRDNDGQVNREDAVDMLTNLGISLLRSILKARLNRLQAKTPPHWPHPSSFLQVNPKTYPSPPSFPLFPTSSLPSPRNKNSSTLLPPSMTTTADR